MKEGGDVAREDELDELAYVACLPCIFARMVEESHGEFTTDPHYKLIIHPLIHPSTSKKKKKGGERRIEAEEKKPGQFQLRRPFLPLYKDLRISPNVKLVVVVVVSC